MTIKKIQVKLKKGRKIGMFLPKNKSEIACKLITNMKKENALIVHGPTLFISKESPIQFSISELLGRSLMYIYYSL